ncbi:MAG: hypothetical protein NZT92_00855 [Abditibacteriales bacterium]|nr:hypothetical protein [Abditibacteriales bacterium]MDW8364942.1 hypothetical protein [Abditibacteriales bacterium]
MIVYVRRMTDGDRRASAGVLEGLRDKADPHRRGVVTVAALLDYVAHTVSTMTNGRQNPWLPRAEQFDLQLRLAHIKPQ